MALMMSASLSTLAQADSSALAQADSNAPPAPAQAEAGRAAANTTGTITVEVEGLRNERGQVLFALFRSSAGFPRQPRRAAQRRSSAIHEGRARVVFENVPPGEFAVSVLHDEDGDFELKTGLFGKPEEGLGFSRNARAMFGPPSFDDAKLRLAEKSSAKLMVEIHYY